MMEKGLKSSHLLVKEMNKNQNKKKERVGKSKAISAAASKKFCLCAGSFKCLIHGATAASHTRSVSSSASKKVCLCAPPTHPGSFKCRLHRSLSSSHTRIVSSSAYHVNGVKYIRNLNPSKLVGSSQSSGIRNSNKGNVHGRPKLSRFGRAALANAAAAATSSVQIQPLSAAFRQMSLN
ncbi:hypothetical protein RND71_030943 [Anisodus tanguticus]|uniref:Serine-rich protein-like protein n=1 Tax=Anisodus tanguticus TaxID=243964 RepID=A0AAE1RHD3_9SOLA|nr:hypothetical protein RND71_030943 [Anisodus tanguticus]